MDTNMNIWYKFLIENGEGLCNLARLHVEFLENEILQHHKLTDTEIKKKYLPLYQPVEEKFKKSLIPYQNLLLKKGVTKESLREIVECLHITGTAIQEQSVLLWNIIHRYDFRRTLHSSIDETKGIIRLTNDIIILIEKFYTEKEAS